MLPSACAFPTAGLAGNTTDSARAAVPIPQDLPRGCGPLSGSSAPVAISLAHTSGSLPPVGEAYHGWRVPWLPSHVLGQPGRAAARWFFAPLLRAASRSAQHGYAVP